MPIVQVSGQWCITERKKIIASSEMTSQDGERDVISDEEDVI